MPNSPAAKAGLKPGDVLLKLNRMALRTEDDLKQALKNRQQGKAAPLYLMRDGRKLLVPIE